MIEQGCASILDAIYDGILVADASAVVRYVNPEYTRITGVNHEEIVGRPLAEVRPGAILPEVIRSGVPRAGVFRRVGAIEYVVDMAPIIIAGRIVGGVSVLKDLTEVQRLSQELRKYVNRVNRLHTIVRDSFRARFTFEDIVGESDAIHAAVAFARRIARVESDVLITGESGTGKEVFAQAIHNASSRAAAPFIAFNCAALSPSLIESELFGYGEGAFTGARRSGKVGFFEIADGGTVLLDEIAELSVEMQAKLLRTIQERRIRRIGETEEIPVDVRIIAATNRDLEQRVREGRFREDLYYRINVVNIHLPPLLARKSDVRPLADHFLGRCRARLGRNLSFSDAAYEALLNHDWPGNVRELQNAVEHAASLADSEIIEPEHLPRVLQKRVTGRCRGNLRQLLREVERQTIIERLNHHGRTVAAKKRVARELGLSLSTLYSKMKLLGINDHGR